MCKFVGINYYSRTYEDAGHNRIMYNRLDNGSCFVNVDQIKEIAPVIDNNGNEEGTRITMVDGSMYKTRVLPVQFLGIVLRE